MLALPKEKATHCSPAQAASSNYQAIRYQIQPQNQDDIFMNFESLVKEINPESFELKYSYGRAIMAQAKKETKYPCKSLSVVIPSRLQKNPVGKFWLEDAVESIMNQSINYNLDIEIIVGVDNDSDLDAVPKLPHVKYVRSNGKSQAHALNSAILLARGEVITFLEDDDIWHPKKIDEGMIALNHFDFISSNQLEFIVDSNGLRLFQKINEYPIPSGWMMKRDLFNHIGAFDTDFKYHLDSEWIGRLNQFGATRCHMVEMGCPAASLESVIKNRSKLGIIMYQSALGSCLWSTKENHPLVYRATHPGSGMSKIATDVEAGKISSEEHRMIHEVNKMNPW